MRLVSSRRRLSVRLCAASNASARSRRVRSSSPRNPAVRAWTSGSVLPSTARTWTRSATDPGCITATALGRCAQRTERRDEPRDRALLDRQPLLLIGQQAIDQRDPRGRRDDIGLRLLDLGGERLFFGERLGRLVAFGIGGGVELGRALGGGGDCARASTSRRCWSAMSD